MVASVPVSSWFISIIHYAQAHDWKVIALELDNKDRRILKALQENGRLQNVELAKRVGLSPSPCLRRVKRLEDAGVIERYAALIDPAKVGLKLTVFVRIWLSSQDLATVERFNEQIKALPQVQECHLMAGDSDFLLRVLVKDLEDYRRFQMEHLTRIDGVQQVKTEIPMQQIKQTLEVPL